MFQSSGLLPLAEERVERRGGGGGEKKPLDDDGLEVRLTSHSDLFFSTSPPPSLPAPAHVCLSVRRGRRREQSIFFSPSLSPCSKISALELSLHLHSFPLFSPILSEQSFVPNQQRTLNKHRLSTQIGASKVHETYNMQRVYRIFQLSFKFFFPYHRCWLGAQDSPSPPPPLHF